VRSWSKLLSLSPGEKRLLLASMVSLPINGLALRMMSLSRWRALLSRRAMVLRAGQNAPSGSQLISARRIARMVRVAASRGPYRGNCLQQSLTLWWLLDRQSIESEIRFGARTQDGKFEAHAWVEVEGIALNEAPGIQDRFKRFEPARAEAETI
jgi:transglutaminase superfamily protein